MKASKDRSEKAQFDYDVCLSFAGENRDYASECAEVLRNKGIRVFYDEYEEAELWGKDLYSHLHDVYSSFARYCVVFISEHYAKKLWTNHERRAAQARAFEENSEYILPARFDDTPIQGLPDTVGYIDLKGRSPEDLAALIGEKLGQRQRHEYLPPVPNRLFQALDAEDEMAKENIAVGARSFFESLKRMTGEEREMVFNIFLHGCPAELPENIHMNIDLLRRYIGLTPARIKKIMGQIASLGFDSYVREDTETDGHLGKKEMLVVNFMILNAGYDDEVDRGTEIANEMIRLASDAYCEEYALEALRRLDFHQLADSTFEEDSHDAEEA
jgi:hypothetical protein